MNTFRALGYRPHGYGSITPLPEGGWFIKNHPIDGPHFLAYPDKEPKDFWGICPIQDKIEVINYKMIGEFDPYHERAKRFGSEWDGEETSVIYSCPSKLEECVPAKGVFSAILSPSDKKPQVFNKHLIPKESEAFKAALGVTEDRYTLLVSRVGGLFRHFDLPHQKTAYSMPSCDGLTVLVVQEDVFTIFDNPLV